MPLDQQIRDTSADAHAFEYLALRRASCPAIRDMTKPRASRVQRKGQPPGHYPLHVLLGAAHGLVRLLSLVSFYRRKPAADVQGLCYQN